MYAIIATCGKQYRVEEGQKLLLDRLDAEEGADITFDQVLILGGDNTVVGAPLVAGASVTGKVVSHTQGDKVITFKYNRRHRTRRRVGSRHAHTTVEITSIKA